MLYGSLPLLGTLVYRDKTANSCCKISGLEPFSSLWLLSSGPCWEKRRIDDLRRICHVTSRALKFSLMGDAMRDEAGGEHGGEHGG